MDLKNRIPAFVYESTPDRNFHITPLPRRLRERRELGARIRQDCRQIIGTFWVITGGLLPRDTRGKSVQWRESEITGDYPEACTCWLRHDDQVEFASLSRNDVSVCVKINGIIKKDRMELSHRSSNRPTNTTRSRVEVLMTKPKLSHTGKRTVPSGIPGHPPQAIQLSVRWNSGQGGNRGCSCGYPACSCSGSPNDNSRPGCSNCRHGSRGSSP